MTEGLFEDPGKTLDHAEGVEEILRRRAAGELYPAIAAALGYSERHVHRLISEAAERCRRDNAALVAKRFLEHDRRCEHLYDVCLRRIQAQIEAGDFDDRVIRAAVTVLDRQARLLGLDASKRVGGGGDGPNAWLDKAPLSDVVREAKILGLELPKEFDTKATARRRKGAGDDSETPRREDD